MEDYITVKGRKIFYKHSGEGPCIVFLHGISTHSALWDGVISNLEKHFSVYAFDLLGFGKSERAESLELSLRSQANLFISAFKSMGLRCITLVGHDIGGGIAQIISLLNPGILKALVLMDSACYDSWPIDLLKVQSRVGMIFEHMPPDVTYQVFQNYIKDGLFNKEMAEEISLKYWEYIKGPEGIKGFLETVKSFDSRQTLEISHLLSRIRLPVLILWGKQDAFIRQSFAYRLSEDIPNSELKIIDSAGHFLPEDKSEEVSREITRFVYNIHNT